MTETRSLILLFADSDPVHNRTMSFLIFRKVHTKFLRLYVNRTHGSSYDQWVSMGGFRTYHSL